VRAALNKVEPTSPRSIDRARHRNAVANKRLPATLKDIAWTCTTQQAVKQSLPRRLSTANVTVPVVDATEIRALLSQKTTYAVYCRVCFAIALG
jgi:hypothetical protein